VSAPARTLVLKDPIEFGDRTITELKFRNKPRMKHYKNIQFKEIVWEDEKSGKTETRMTLANPVDAGIKLISAVTGEFAEVIEELCDEDYAAAMEMVSDFSPPSPATGGK
jgi:hypothetical protein